MSLRGRWFSVFAANGLMSADSSRQALDLHSGPRCDIVEAVLRVMLPKGSGLMGHGRSGSLGSPKVLAETPAPPVILERGILARTYQRPFLKGR